MTMVCDRCGETYDFKYNLVYGNGIQRVNANEERKIIQVPYLEDSIVLCPSCMEKLNDWLKGNDPCRDIK